MTDPDVAFVAAVMDEIDHCPQSPPCEACAERMRSILARGAADERERIIALAEQEARRTSGLGGALGRMANAALRDFIDLLRTDDA